MSSKIDFKKSLPNIYAPKNTEWQEIDIPPLQYIMINGAGNPNTSPHYKAAVEALYSTSYAAKFISKREFDRDYVVPPLEGLWYADDMSVFETFDKDKYKWTMMIMQPEWMTAQIIERAIETAHNKRPDLPHDILRLEQYKEGKCLQLLHVGSYDDEAPKLYALHHKLMPLSALIFNGHHHEIYLSDPRKVVPEKLRTILRQPVR